MSGYRLWTHCVSVVESPHSLSDVTGLDRAAVRLHRGCRTLESI